MIFSTYNKTSSKHAAKSKNFNEKVEQWGEKIENITQQQIKQGTCKLAILSYPDNEYFHSFQNENIIASNNEKFKSGKHTRAKEQSNHSKK